MNKIDSFRRAALISKVIVTALCAALISGCAIDPKTGQPSLKETFASDDPCSHNARNIGVAVGAVVGAIIGNQAKRSNKARMIGAAGGALVGGFIGADMDRRRCELYKIAQKNHIEVAFEDIKSGSDDSAKDQKPGQISRWAGLGHFKQNSSELTPEAKAYFSEIADQYVANRQIQKLEEELATQQQAQQQGRGKASEISTADKEKLRQHYNSLQVVLTGHTDDTGNSEHNARLAEKRAKAVAALFESRGVPAENLYFQGAGESQPIADNRTEEGRNKNRRVEVVEIGSKEELVQYLRSRGPNVEYYRPRHEDVQVVLNKSMAENQAAIGETMPANSKASEKTAHKKSGSKQSKQKQTQQSSVDVESGLAQIEAPRLRSDDMTSTGKAKISQAKSQFMEIDFGGIPATNDSSNEVTASFGEMVKKKQGVLTKLSTLLVNEAQASSDQIYGVSCLKDSPRYEGDVVSLKSGKAIEYRTSEYWPGLYQTSWVSVVNGNYVGLTPVGVLRDSAKSVTSPDMLVYIGKDQPGNVKADFKSGTMTQAYQGTGGVLYRFYPAPKDTQSSVVCGDIVFPNKAPFEGRSGRIYYRKAGVIYSAEFKPKML